MIAEVRALVQLAAIARRIIDTEGPSWEYKFEAVFSIAREVREHLDIRIDYYDPDTTYEADARAYVEALTLKATQLEKLL